MVTSETIVQKSLTSSQKKVIQNIHNNCGHPSKEEFLRALRLSRARPEVLHYVRREFECPACAAKGHPRKPRFPAALPRTFRFNETLGLDLFEIESPDNSKIVFCNMVCWGTLYQLCIPVVDKTAETVAKCVAERWIQYFVVNRAQRCECHKHCVLWWEGGSSLTRVQNCCPLPFWNKGDCARALLKDLPPTQLCKEVSLCS